MDLQQKLKDLLGTESAGAWIGFMEEVELKLPFLLSDSGRPSKEDIENSYIGQHGYKSWKDMVQKGLNWNIHSWNAWSKAYKHVKNNPYLKELKLSASKINTMANNIQSKNLEQSEDEDREALSFPSTPQLWEDNSDRIQTERKAKQKKKAKFESLVVNDLKEKMAEKDSELEQLKVYKERIENYESKTFFGRLFSSP